MPTRPAGIGTQTCAPTTPSTPSMTPARTISAAPPGVSSSACWNRNRTSPGSCSRPRVSSRAVQSSIAMCASCPHACMTPGRREATSTAFLLLDRQPVHVRAQRDNAARTPSAKPAEHARGCRTGDLEVTEGAQGAGHELGGLALLEGQLRVAVQVPAPGYEGRPQLGKLLVELRRTHSLTPSARRRGASRSGRGG